MAELTPAEILAEKSDAVCRMGALMLTSGTGSYRVKLAMGRVAAALGIEQLEAQVSINEIVATTRAHGTFRTQVVEVPVPHVDADRLEELMRLSLQVQPGLTAAELQARLEAVVARRALYPRLVIVGAAALACGAFAFLNNGRWTECLAAALAAACGKYLQVTLGRFRLNQLGTVAAASFTACLVFMLLANLLGWLLPSGLATVHVAAFTSAILFLVPGFPLITAALDLARFDFTSGVSRLMFTLMITLAASLGAWSIAWAFGLPVSIMSPPKIDETVLFLLRLVASFAGVVGFALTFNTPLRVALTAAGIGTIANVMRLTSLDLGANNLLMAALATTLVGLLAGSVNQRILAPRITLSVPAVLIMIPGASTYRAMVGLINGNAMSTLVNGMTAVGIVVALAAGLALARMVTDPAWITARPTWTAMPGTRAQRELRRRAG